VGVALSLQLEGAVHDVQVAVTAIEALLSVSFELEVADHDVQVTVMGIEVLLGLGTMGGRTGNTAHSVHHSNMVPAVETFHVGAPHYSNPSHCSIHKVCCCRICVDNLVAAFPVAGVASNLLYG